MLFCKRVGIDTAFTTDLIQCYNQHHLLQDNKEI